MGRLLAAAGAFFMYFCVGTVLALGIIAGYASWKGFIDRQKLSDMVAVARGAKLASGVNTPSTDSQKATTELTIDELHQRRTMLTRHLELREQAVQNSLQGLEAERDKFRKEREGFDLLVAAFRKERQNTQSQELAKGQEDVRQMLENTKPKVAKDYILKLINDGEKEQVVALLSAMPITKQKKIIEEFKEEDEKKKMYEILQIILHGNGGATESAAAVETPSASEPRTP